ncbi:pyridoxamine 5'-phosphate oxidase family protein [Flavobacteriaceae bacterium F89]|uniref:Pyridoxamine 5'-phosphate oxidase family protein n=1 Tax=Cerina litoralis TaxID=2874477 RepID=A0AAE3EY91_9FLAO|nr:pyridoxamine 5'-phosphate oxidase family protein [Cerina litoralis]MCG2462354.1 pyridoxamine 5'-phosphate oxidase family protein [Cerina litoralis]
MIEDRNGGIKNLKELECLRLLSENYVGRLAFIVSKNPYITPITYFYDAEENSILSYSAPGYKIEAMRKYQSIAFQVDDVQSIQEWRSVLVHGKFEQLGGSTAKKYLHRFSEGVQHTIAEKDNGTPKFIQDFSSRLQQRGIPIVYRIRITDVVGKYRGDFSVNGLQ